MLDGKRNPNTPISSLWPRQPKPSNTQRRLWKRFISSSYLRYIPYWKQNPTTHQIQQEKPTVKQPPNPALSLADCIRKLPRSQRRLLDSLTQVATDDSLWKALRSRQWIHIASDGSLSSNKIGTFGWTIATNTDTLYTCCGPADGPRDTSSSTRSELYGYASAFLLLTNLAKSWAKRYRCKFQWIVDSKAAIQRVLRHTCRDKHKGKQGPRLHGHHHRVHARTQTQHKNLVDQPQATKKTNAHTTNLLSEPGSMSTLISLLKGTGSGEN